MAAPAQANSLEKAAANYAASGQQALAQGHYAEAETDFEKLEKLKLEVAEVHHKYSANALEPEIAERRDFLERRGHMADTYGAMVSRALSVPGFHKAGCADRKSIAAVCVPDLENRPRHAFSFGNDQLEAGRLILGHG